jgi:hypothetical protein
MIDIGQISGIWRISDEPGVCASFGANLTAVEGATKRCAEISRTAAETAAEMA